MSEKCDANQKAPLSPYLNQVLSLGLGDERLQLGSREGVDQAGFGNNE